MHGKNTFLIELIQMVEVFKTNVQKSDEAQVVIKNLLEHFPNAKINFDLEDCDRILRIENETKIALFVINLVKKNGFTCKELSD